MTAFFASLVLVILGGAGAVAVKNLGKEYDQIRYAPMARIINRMLLAATVLSWACIIAGLSGLVRLATGI